MKKQITGNEVSRRRFLGTSAAAAAVLSAGPLGYSCAGSAAKESGSRFNGVQIGAITYSFRNLEPGIENVVKACIDSDVSSIELMSNYIESWCGAPEVFRAPRRPNPDARPAGAAPAGAPPAQGAVIAGGASPSGMSQQQTQQAYTEEEYAAFEKQQADSEAALSAWRKNPPYEKFAELAKKFMDAGVDIHLVKWSPARWSDDDIDFAFKATQAMGVKAVTDELGEEAVKKLAPFAEKYGMYAVFHNHMQFAQEGFDVVPMLAVSPAVMLNFDIGHYQGSTGKDPLEFLKAHQERIFSIHLKDKTLPDTDPPNTNQVWGQGQTSLKEVLLYIRDNQVPVYCDIELEYPIAPWSDSVKETATCVRYARQILI
jgi:sugar phosphate isomerase/epimerase